MFFANLNEVFERNRMILDRYPFLWPRDENGRKLLVEQFGYSRTQLDDVPSGWMSSFGYLMLDSVLNLLHSEHIEPDQYQMTIGVGSGRISLHGSIPNEKIQLLFDGVEYRSERTCSSCGSAATHRLSSNKLPLCEKCKQTMMGQTNLSHQDFENLMQLPEWYKITDSGTFVFNGEIWTAI